jgi:hypothetical protein
MHSSSPRESAAVVMKQARSVPSK